ncbi:hypothetical protein [Burkholderia ubonensis]|uniref:hypothetical protein n=1 Tax=Burkholderia ubonensis TaxID=101571 RepID=UPI000A5A42F8|nr:hypothetical protein [Burkholderia ubonensis]
MDEREMFEAHFGIPVDQRRAPSKGSYALREHQMMWAGWQAGRRTTPDRDALVEEIADTIDHMGEGRFLEEYVEAIRTFKTTPTASSREES